MIGHAPELFWKDITEYIPDEALERPKEIYKVGYLYKYIGGGMAEPKEETYYILAEPQSYLVCLINLRRGQRWSAPMKVDNPQNITEKEFSIMAGFNFINMFKRVHLAIKEA
jgi:hypothetical protein